MTIASLDGSSTVNIGTSALESLCASFSHICVMLCLGGHVCTGSARMIHVGPCAVYLWYISNTVAHHTDTCSYYTCMSGSIHAHATP